MKFDSILIFQPVSYSDSLMTSLLTVMVTVIPLNLHETLLYGGHLLRHMVLFLNFLLYLALTEFEISGSQ